MRLSYILPRMRKSSRQSQRKSDDFAMSMPSASTSPSPSRKGDDEAIPQTRMSKVKSHFYENIGVDIYFEIELLFLSFGMGIQDATTFPIYHCFASNQTGNTVFLAIKTADIGLKDSPFANIGCSLAFFLLGSLISGQIGHWVGPKSRLWIVLTSVFQTILVIIATIIQYTIPILPTGAATLTIISMLAFAAGAQVTMTRPFGITEITTAVVTAAYVDICGDARLFAKKNRPRNRRFIFVIVMTLGSFVGAFAHQRVNPSFGLLLTCVIKICVTIAMTFNKGVEKSTDFV